MLRTAAWMTVMATMAIAWGQDAPGSDVEDCSKRMSEIEDRQGECCKKGKPVAWAGYTKGVLWERDFQVAMARAKKERCLVMLWYLVGDADMEGC